MPIIKLQFKPNINKESTTYAQEGEYRDCDKIRFRSGYPEKIGGWVRLNNTTFAGSCRALLSWTTLSEENLLGVGTNLKYYIERGGAYNDITPIRRTATLTNPFSTFTTTLTAAINATATVIPVATVANLAPQGTVKIDNEELYYGGINGLTLINVIRGVDGTLAAPHTTGALVASSMLRVVDNAHGAVTQDYVTFSGAVAVDGISAALINKEYQVSVLDSTTYYIDVGFYATATASGGGTVIATYQENTGLEVNGGAAGWGAGGWSEGSWGNTVGTGVGASLRIWNHTAFGEDLIFGPRGGRMYYWDASAGFTQRGVLLSTLPGASDVPVAQNQLLVTDARIVVAFGANTVGSLVQDPLLIRWSDVEFPQFWTSTPTNAAGDYRLTNGSTIVTAVQTREEILVFTDTALYSMQFVGAPDVFIFKLLADNISIAGPNAVITANNVVYWMGRDKFYTYTGRSDTLPCSVRQFVFDGLNQDQAAQVYAGLNPGFNEVWWFYPDDSSPINNRYVTWNYLDQAWAVGSMQRDAWLYTGTRGFPVAASSNRLVAHEIGHDDALQDTPAPITAYIETGDFDIGDGDRFLFLRRIIPDLTFEGSSAVNPSVMLTFFPRTSSGAAYRTEENPTVVRGTTVPFEQFTEYVYIRARGRQGKFRVESTGMGTTWQLGLMRFEVRPDGRRA